MVGGLLDVARNGVFGDLFINMDYSDFPMESLEGDELDGGHQDAKVQGLLGPFSSEALLGSSLASGGNNRNAIPILVPSLSGIISSLFCAPLKMSVYLSLHMPFSSEALLGSSLASVGNNRNAIPILVPSLSGLVSSLFCVP
ncbi:hypothetical protein Acr_00g0051760 [Actinidia rufa]|uniref:Uncharacterized protein n=1 Tax=Actinidia rufa TaxID=165716 RepID=A0A7J0DL56_9ERIC|nr:hypothetical protein Acr_00g0051760 [Actinidia rufa]